MIYFKKPLITCTMVTNGRFELIKKSISCFIRQTYLNKNLVILSQGCDSDNKKIQQHVRSLGRDDILFLTAPSRLSLGAMRNTSVELAKGEIICQWDDDDLYGSDRLMAQYNALRSNSGNLCSVYSNFLKYFRTSGELYWCDWSGEPLVSHKYLCGSVMFYKKTFHMYRQFYPEHGSQSHVEEDLNVLEKLIYSGGVGEVKDGNQYIYIFHGENTYDLEHHKLTLNTNWGKKVFDNDELLSKRNLLEETFDEMQINEMMSVRSLDSVAFLYQPKGIDNEV